MSLSSLADITIPVLVVKGPLMVTVEAGVDVYSELGFGAHDTFDGNLTSSVIVQSQVPLDGRVGVYDIRYRVSDSSSNMASVVRTVTIVDTKAPSIVLREGQLTRLELNDGYIEPGFQAWDLYEGNLTHKVIIEGSAGIVSNMSGK